MPPRTRADLDRVVATIAHQQRDDGSIPWFDGGVVDPWDHVEAAMGLDVGGRHVDAERAYEWLAATQRSDGAWFAAYRDGGVADRTLDANFVAYAAAGVWHHYLSTGDEGFLHRMWWTVERAIDFTLDLQMEDGAVAWARDADYRPWPAALLTSSSCIHLSLGCAIALAEHLGHERPDWELSLSALARAVHEEEAGFEDKSRYAMDWYYPVIGGVLSGSDAKARLESRWDEFVVPQRGSRCVSDRPWVTTGETAELVLALAVAGFDDVAVDVLRWIHYLQADDGSYWTGATFPDDTIWPRERPTWCAGAVALAADALEEGSATRQIFTGEAVVRMTLSDPLADPA